MDGSDRDLALPKPSITVKTKHLYRLHKKIHASAIVVIPTAGSLVAGILALQSGVGAMEISLLLSFYLLTLIGITVGFHRHFSHCSFQAYPAVRVALAILGAMACQGPLVYWVSNHRRHHQFSDLPGDPHSPYYDGERALSGWRGFFHAHMEWTFSHEITNSFLFAKDLIKDPLISRVNQLYYAWVGLSLGLPVAIGWGSTGTVEGAWLGFLWGGCVRLFLTYHFTNAIDSVTHLYGRRPFDTRENSTNNLWIALPTLGESWHNNHHAFPQSAIFGLKGWQVDIGGWVVRGLEALGLAWDVKRPSQDAIAAKLDCS